MEEPASKRRRTSPPEDRDRSTSPLKKPPRRPSYSSPTKASLSRYNPNLLPRLDSPPKRPPSQDERGGFFNRGKAALSYILGRTEEESQSQETPSQDLTRNDIPDLSSAGADHTRTDLNSDTVTPRARKRGTNRIYEVDDEEEELPATPSTRERDKQDTPRRGILWSSPSKRPPRLKEPMQPSALNPKALSRKGSASQIQDPLAVENQEQVPNHEQPLDNVEKPRPSFDPELEKKKHEKERLLRQLRVLEDEVDTCVKEVQRKQHTAQNIDKLIQLVDKLGGANDSQEKPASAVSNLLCSFLPFTPSVVPPQAQDVQDKPIASHRPVQLDDPLPYLQMFTSFQFSTQISLPKGYSVSHNKVHQVHTIDITGPQKLLTSTISATINALTGDVLDLQVLRLSGWAERDLGKFVRQKAQEKDLSNLCWAIQSYWDLAKKRADFWHRCEAQFPHLIPGRTSQDTENISRIPAKRAKGAQSLTRKDLYRHLGRDVLVLEDRHVILKVTWRIGFDWTGEAESEVGVEPAFPAVWTEADSHNSLRKVSATFDSLVQTKGVFEATRLLAELIFGDAD
ncbi:hypothetical protein BDV96DRAFT_581475 [Lophiotrema nucula]|uniref:Uncharacterized protein n=1 Tax=Lophiotrema nucula TaxID=690887 RepID=A0A6A5YX32_9PLEO|nr:hypothetical protein BDV96DRAFT_581475 [Lophiotrema nucula]